MALFFQALYWISVCASIYNLILIASERFMAVIYPFHYQRIRLFHIYLLITINYLFAICVLVGPGGFLQLQYHNGKCINAYYFTTKAFSDFMYFYALLWFFFSYVFPCAVFFILYGWIIFYIRRRLKQSNLGTSRIISNANDQITRCTIAVTVFFIIALGYGKQKPSLHHFFKVFDLIIIYTT